jgi:hypothetical protein
MRDKLIHLIESAGGRVEDKLFVLESACVLVAAHELTADGERLLESLHIDTTRPDYEQFGEFNSRITYLSFPRQEGGSSVQYNRDMVEKHQHLSVHGATSATFLLAGIALETSMELIAHGEARVARLSSSKTRAMNDPLYRLLGTPPERELQRTFIRAFLELRSRFEEDCQPRATPTGCEFFNILNLGCKATALTYTMSLKDYHKLFIGRLPEPGNEYEVRDICTRMCQQLHERYPLVIRKPEEYRGTPHGEKYKV